jgi:signal transduction histidine kinase
LVRDKNNNITRVVGVNSDITDRKMAEKALMKSEQELRMANATKDKLFSILAHDLVSPFTSVLGYSKLLMLSCKEKNFEKVSEYSHPINLAAIQTFDLLTNLLEWSRSQREKIQFQPESINLKKIIDQVNLLYSHVLDEKEIYLEIQIPKNFDLIADPNMVYTVIRNLVSNAIKYTEEEGIVKITASRDKKTVEICISDTGQGISKDNLEQIIKPELNFSTMGSGSEKGTGLGLIICKDFVERHGGKIWIESKENIGTSVFFTIPENPSIDK